MNTDLREQIAALRRLAEQASQGWPDLLVFGDYGDYPFTEEVCGVLHDDDIAYLMALDPQSVSSLLDQVGQLLAENERLREEICPSDAAAGDVPGCEAHNADVDGARGARGEVRPRQLGAGVGGDERVGHLDADRAPGVGQDSGGSLDGELEALRQRYAEPEIPPCRVCGAALSVSRCGGGEPTKWNCSSEDAAFLASGYHEGWDGPRRAHYHGSEYVQYQHGDEDVLALLDALDAATEQRDRLAEALRGVLAVVWEAEHDSEQMNAAYLLAREALHPHEHDNNGVLCRGCDNVDLARAALSSLPDEGEG